MLPVKQGKESFYWDRRYESRKGKGWDGSKGGMSHVLLGAGRVVFGLCNYIYRMGIQATEQGLSQY